MTQYFQEPTPLPIVLRGYEDVLPGGAERIVTMVEEEARHRREIEHQRLMLDSKLEFRCQLFSFSIAAGIIALSFLLIATELTP